MLIIGFYGCSAPRDNPYDPASPLYQPVETIPAVVLSATSMHYADWVVDDRFWLSFSARFQPSMAPDSVRVLKDSIPLFDLQAGNLERTYWVKTVDEADLYSASGGPLEALVGYPLKVAYRAPGGVVRFSETTYLKRVIMITPEVQFPDYDTTLTTRKPELGWSRYYASYNFSYTVEVNLVTATNFRTVVYRKEGIPLDSTTHTVATNLPQVSDPEFLFWTVSVVDDFGNSARSLEARFRIK